MTSIAVYLPNDERYRSSVTATIGFHAPYRGRFRITVTPAGEVVGASWRAWRVGGGGGEEEDDDDVGRRRREREGRGDFDVVIMKQAPGVVFDKGGKGKGVASAGGEGGMGVGGKEGDEGEGAEKTFLQK